MTVPDIHSGAENIPRQPGRLVSGYILIILLFYVVYVFISTAIDSVQDSVEVMGWWGFLPLIVVCVSSVFMIAFVLFRRKHSSSSRSTEPTNWLAAICRTACVLVYMSLALLIINYVLSIPRIFEDWILAINMSVLFMIGWYFYFESYQWYWRCWYEKLIIAQNEEMYGDTIFVSVPIFKFCGHFVVVIRDRKYELGLDENLENRPFFRHKLVGSSEMEAL